MLPRSPSRCCAATTRHGVRDADVRSGDLGLDRITALIRAPFSTGVVAAGTIVGYGHDRPGHRARRRRTASTPTSPGRPASVRCRLRPAGRASPRPSPRPAGDGRCCSSASTPMIPRSPDRIVRTDAGGQRDDDLRRHRPRPPRPCRSPRAVAVQADGRVVVVGDHPPASAREAQGFALARLFGGDAVSNVRVRGSARVRKGALRLRLSCSAGPGCAGVVRGRATRRDRLRDRRRAQRQGRRARPRAGSQAGRARREGHQPARPPRAG